VVDAGADPKEAANVLSNAFAATGVDPARVDPYELAKLVAARAELQREAFDEALAHAGDDGFSAEPYLAQRVVGDVAALDPVIDAIIAANPGQVAAFRGGKEGLLGFFVGQVMKETGGKADPRVVNERVRAKLG
jgi:Asp-tRNA(Asn)/Glu-tRNA(Gln) amidotransferase B subunit